MRRIILIAISAVCSICALAQSLESGFYRVSNLKTGRYVYVTDNKGSIVIQAGTADMGAIELWADHSRALYDPASVIYAEYISSSSGGAKYDLKAQGTGVYEILKYYVFAASSKGSYQVYAEGKYLSDDNKFLTNPQGQMGSNNTGDYRRWVVSKIDNKNEFFGIRPTVTANGRYFHPFYAGFGFSLLGEGMKVWVVNSVYNDVVEMVPFAGDTVPALTPVVIECGSESVDLNKLDIININGSIAQTNKLKGVLFDNVFRKNCVVVDDSKMRVLGTMPDGNLGYVLSDVTPHYYDGKRHLAANQSYIEVPANSADNLRVVFLEDAVEDIVPDNGTKAVYTIWGARIGDYIPSQIEELPAGIYIIDNRKVIIR